MRRALFGLILVAFAVYALSSVLTVSKGGIEKELERQVTDPDTRHKNVSFGISTAFSLAQSMKRSTPYKRLPESIDDIFAFDSAQSEQHGLKSSLERYGPYFDFRVADCGLQDQCLIAANARGGYSDPSFCIIEERMVRADGAGSPILTIAQCAALPLWKQYP